MILQRTLLLRVGGSELTEHGLGAAVLKAEASR